MRSAQSYPIDGFASSAGRLTVGPASLTGYWVNLTAGLPRSPPRSWDWRTAYDSVDRSVIMFGGCALSNQLPCRNQTWSWNGSAGWRLLNNGSRPSPSARQGPMMAYDPKMGAVILFGGDRLGQAMSDTWAWKGGRWSNISSKVGTAPAARFDAEMAWDPAVSAIVLFGGSWCVLSGCTDTWEFHGKWVQVTTATDPPGRNYYGLVYDRAAHALILSMGQAYGPNGWYALNDTWTFNGTAWIPWRTAHAPPPEMQAVMAYDAAQRCIVYAPVGTGATWVFRGGDWHNITQSLNGSPPSLALPAFAYDARTGSVIMNGGATGVPLGGGAYGNATTDETWVWA
ncbi:MAG TPA: hypothetical protein VFF67_04550 [Thermoplasmata archaeon]|nr:hypothetical protein [Thermoplasmata archaeon]